MAIIQTRDTSDISSEAILEAAALDAAIKADAAKNRANHTGALPPAVLNDAIAETLISDTGLVIKDEVGGRWRIQVNTTGALTIELVMSAIVSNYFEATGIPSASAEKLGLFFSAISPAVLSAFNDGAVLKLGFATINGATIKTLRNRALTLYNSPTLGNCGLIFNGTNQAAKNNFATPIQKRTLICLQQYRQNFQTPITSTAVGYHVFSGYPYNGIAGEALEFASSNTAADVYSTANSGGGKVQMPSPGVSRSFPPRSYFSAYTYDSSTANGAAEAFTFRVEGGTVLTAAAAANNATLAEAPLYHQKASGVFIGGAAAANINNILNAPATERFCANATGGWFMFNRILTEDEITSVFVAARVLFPKWKYVTEGDSIIQFTTPTFLTMPEIWGANMTHVNYAAGGTPTPTIVAGLGTTRLTASALASIDGTPVIFDCFSSDSFTGYDAAAQYADYKTIWAFVRASNPTAIIIARTYTYGRTDGIYLEATRLVDRAGQEAFNALMRDDFDNEAGFFDILIDACEIADGLNVGSGYEHHGLNPGIIQDTVHPTPALSTAVGLAIIEAVEAFGATIR